MLSEQYESEMAKLQSEAAQVNNVEWKKEVEAEMAYITHCFVNATEPEKHQWEIAGMSREEWVAAIPW